MSAASPAKRPCGLVDLVGAPANRSVSPAARRSVTWPSGMTAVCQAPPDAGLPVATLRTRRQRPKAFKKSVGGAVQRPAPCNPAVRDIRPAVMGIRRSWRVAGMATLLVLTLTACARAVAGVAEPGGTLCTAEDARPRTPSTPTDAPVITVDDRVNWGIQNAHTAPLGLAVYGDGTVIRADGDGSSAEPLPPMVIGRIDTCRVREAVDALFGLGGVDLGMPQVTDLGTTTVTVTRQGSGKVILSAYGLGVGDEYVSHEQAAARATLTTTIDAIVEAMPAEKPWAPNRLQLTRFERATSGPALQWPLSGSISDVLERRTQGRLPCGVLDGVNADAVTAALDGGPALALWDDGSDPATLAVGVLVPGQPACAG